MTDGAWAAAGVEVLVTKDFENGQLNRSGTYVVCFAAAWCPVTRRFMPKFIAQKSAMRGTLAIADITDLKDPLWDVFRIRITPSIVVFRDGVEHLRADGKRFLGVTGGALEKLQERLASN